MDKSKLHTRMLLSIPYDERKDKAHVDKLILTLTHLGYVLYITDNYNDGPHKELMVEVPGGDLQPQPMPLDNKELTV